MRDHDNSLVAKHASDAMLEYVLANVCIHSGQNIVQEVHIGLGVHRSRQAHALLLTPGKVDAAKKKRKEMGALVKVEFDSQSLKSWQGIGPTIPMLNSLRAF